VSGGPSPFAQAEGEKISRYVGRRKTFPHQIPVDHAGEKKKQIILAGITGASNRDESNVQRRIRFSDYTNSRTLRGGIATVSPTLREAKEDINDVGFRKATYQAKRAVFRVAPTRRVN